MPNMAQLMVKLGIVLLVTNILIDGSESSCTSKNAKMGTSWNYLNLICTISADVYGPKTQITDERGYNIFHDISFNGAFYGITMRNIPGGTLVANFFPQQKQILQIFLNHTSLAVVTPGAFNGCNNLTELYLQDNSIQEITKGMFNSLTELVALHLERNAINAVDSSSFVAMENLKILLMSDNKITTLGTDTFTFLTRLELLDLSHNPLKNLKQLNLKTVTLNLRSTNLSDVVIRMESNSENTKHETIRLNSTYIESLDLSHNQLKMFDIDANLTHLKYLNLSHNLIAAFEPKIFDHQSSIPLQSLDISNNNLHTVFQPVFFFSELRDLNMCNNIINQISSGVFSSHLGKLISLDLHNNQINSLPNGLFANLTSLQRLDLSGNQIESLPFGIFDNLDLIALNLSRNLISDVSFVIGIKSPSLLHLDDNRIKHINIDYIKAFMTLSLDKNLWSCNCLADVVLKLDSRRVELIDGNSRKTSNIRGISCNSTIAVSCETSPSTNFSDFAFVDFFDRGYINTSFFRYLNLFNASLANLSIEEEKKYIRNMTVTLHKVEELVGTISKSNDNYSDRNQNDHHVFMYFVAAPLYVIMIVMIALLYYKITEKRYSFRVPKIENHDAAGLL